MPKYQQTWEVVIGYKMTFRKQRLSSPVHCGTKDTEGTKMSDGSFETSGDISYNSFSKPAAQTGNWLAGCRIGNNKVTQMVLQYGDTCTKKKLTISGS